MFVAMQLFPNLFTIVGPLCLRHDLQLRREASKLSNNFCQLQSGLNVAEGKPSHYDLYSNPHHRVSGGSLVRRNSRDISFLYSGGWWLFCASAACLKHHFLVDVMLLSSSLFLFFSLQEGLVPGFK